MIDFISQKILPINLKTLKRLGIDEISLVKGQGKFRLSQVYEAKCITRYINQNKYGRAEGTKLFCCIGYFCAPNLTGLFKYWLFPFIPGVTISGARGAICSITALFTWVNHTKIEETPEITIGRVCTLWFIELKSAVSYSLLPKYQPSTQDKPNHL
ncbi:MAG: hypothetical protein F6K10_10900 [Moorea sp. SIO2B7]|nr:hypothetical protein [Moorena sp. SIO2B7]